MASSWVTQRIIASFCAGVMAPVMVVRVGMGTPSSPVSHTTWAVQVTPSWAPLSTMYALSSRSMMDFIGA